jgi:hypothetical protein
MRLDNIEPSEKIDGKVVRAVQKRMRDGWPPTMPLIVAYGISSNAQILDGNHRLRAALLEGIEYHDVLLLPDEVQDHAIDHDLDVISLTQVMALYDPLMRDNYRDDGGQPKCRNAW